MNMTAMSPEDYARREAEGRDPVEIWAELPTVDEILACLTDHIGDTPIDTARACTEMIRDHIAQMYASHQTNPLFKNLVLLRTVAVFKDTDKDHAIADSEEHKLILQWVVA